MAGGSDDDRVQVSSVNTPINAAKMYGDRSSAKTNGTCYY